MKICLSTLYILHLHLIQSSKSISSFILSEGKAESTNCTPTSPRCALIERRSCRFGWQKTYLIRVSAFSSNKLQQYRPQTSDKSLLVPHTTHTGTSRMKKQAKTDRKIDFVCFFCKNAPSAIDNFQACAQGHAALPCCGIGMLAPFWLKTCLPFKQGNVHHSLWWMCPLNTASFSNTINQLAQCINAHSLLGLSVLLSQ